jgi:hypothetical protein
MLDKLHSSTVVICATQNTLHYLYLLLCELRLTKPLTSYKPTVVSTTSSCHLPVSRARTTGPHRATLALATLFLFSDKPEKAKQNKSSIYEISLLLLSYNDNLRTTSQGGSDPVSESGVKVREDREPFRKHVLGVVICFQALQTAVVGSE